MIYRRNALRFSAPVWRRSCRDLRVKEIAHPLDLLDRAELRADQDLLEPHLLDLFDAPARRFRRTDEIDRRQFRQLRAFRALLQVDRAIGEDGIAAAGLAIDL